MISEANFMGYGRTNAVLQLKNELENKGAEVYLNSNFKNADIIHAHTPLYYTLFALKKFRNKRLVATIHSLPTSYKEYFKSKIISEISWKYYQKIYRKFDKVIAPTKFVQKIIAERGINSEVISNGIDLRKFKKSRNAARKFREKFNLENFVFSAGRWQDPRKDNKTILAIAKEFPEMNFVHAGNVLKPKIKNVKNLKFLGLLKRKEMVGAYSSSKFLIHPSKFETEGLVILEAMACKNPIIARNLETYKGLLNSKNSFLCDNFWDFRKAVKILNENPKLRKRMGKNAYKAAKEKDIKKTSARYIEIYEELAGN